MTESGVVSIGLAGALGPQTIAEVAPHVERAGFHALWVNDTPTGDSLAALAAAARVTDRLVLATGVIPVDRRPADDILAGLDGIPADRLVLGIGSGGLDTGALAAVRDAVTRLRAGTSARVVVGALGPRMRRLGAQHADGILLNWVTPQIAREQRDQARAVAPAARTIVYARTALDEASVARMRREADAYGAVPKYAANFARLGVSPIDTTLPRPGRSLAEGVEAYAAAADELVLRAITAGDDAAAVIRFVEAGADVARS